MVFTPETQRPGTPRLEIRPRCKLSTPSPEPQPSPGPERHLSTEALAGIRNGLRGHERRGPCRAGQLGVVPLKLVADAEVSNLHMAVVPQEQVGRLDVPVDDLLIVHCRERQLQRRPGDHGPELPPSREACLKLQVGRSPHALLLA